jgi:hypothetical protein
MSRRFSRAEIEQIRIASENHLLPVGYMGLGRVSFHDLAAQILEAMDEIERREGTPHE